MLKSPGQDGDVMSLTELRQKQTFSLNPRPPYNFDANFHKPSHFPSSDNTWETGNCWITMLWQGQSLGLKFVNSGTIDRPSINVGIYSQKALSKVFLDCLIPEIRWRFNFDTDISGFSEKYNSDAVIGAIIDKWQGMKPVAANSLYETLIIYIVLQNATVRRSVNMMQALFENYGTLLSYDDKELYCFWEPEVVDRATEQELRDLKVGYRAKSIKRVTDAFVRGEVDESELRIKSREEQQQALLALYGIGPASVGYILGDVFHHLDEFDHISPWEQKIYSKLFFDADPDEPVSVDRLMALFNRRFGGYRMLAIHYLWEDLFWKRKQEAIEWLEKLIRL